MGDKEQCKGEPGRLAPVIDRNRCEAKEACVSVCPFDVFEIRPLDAVDRDALSLLGKVKAWVHGNRQAYVVRPTDCHACQLCLKACPEEAIRLVPYRSG
jgi:4Fe-4S ferredoxin